jgi:hypothetical protein
LVCSVVVNLDRKTLYHKENAGFDHSRRSVAVRLDLDFEAAQLSLGFRVGCNCEVTAR